MRDRQKERKARTRRLIQEGAILEKALPQTTQMTLEQLEDFYAKYSNQSDDFFVSDRLSGRFFFFPKGALSRYSTIRGNSLKNTPSVKAFRKISSDNVSAISGSRATDSPFDDWHDSPLMRKPFLVPIPDMPVHSSCESSAYRSVVEIEE